MFDDEANLSLVQSVVAMARNLGLSIIAEGIEEIEQARTLRELGVDLGQGFLFGRPVPVHRAEEVFATWQRPDFL